MCEYDVTTDTFTECYDASHPFLGEIHRTAVRSRALTQEARQVLAQLPEDDSPRPEVASD